MRVQAATCVSKRPHQDGGTVMRVQAATSAWPSGFLAVHVHNTRTAGLSCVSKRPKRPPQDGGTVMRAKRPPQDGGTVMRAKRPPQDGGTVMRVQAASKRPQAATSKRPPMFTTPGRRDCHACPSGPPSGPRVQAAPKRPLLKAGNDFHDGNRG